MRSPRFGIIATLCLSVLPAVLAAVPALASSADRTDADETVVVYSAKGAQTNIGAGVIVGRHGDALVVATAAHVIADGPLHVQLDSGAVLSVVGVEKIPGFDLAMLETSAYDGRISSAALGQPSDGEKVHVWGHRLTQSYVESQASVIDVDPILPEGPADGR